MYPTRGLCTKNKVRYVDEEWISVPLRPSDCISTAKDKFQHEVTTQDLLVETLIREAQKEKNDSDELYELSEIPQNFFKLVNSNIISSESDSELDSELDVELDSELAPELAPKLNKNLWIAFGHWLGFKGQFKRRQVRQHLRLNLQKLKYSLTLQNNNLQTVPTKSIPRKEQGGMIVVARDLWFSKEIKSFNNIVNPICIVDKNNRTLVHLELLDDPEAIKKSTEAVNLYYHHTLQHPSHRSNSFWENFREHFGVFALNNLLPYTSKHTASSHNIEHLECVNKLLHDLIPLSNSVNRFLQKYYEDLFENLRKLKWGPFAPRLFGVFPMIAINYNSISDYHWDENDDPNSFCCLVALGDFEGGEVCFPQLKIFVSLKPGQVLLFPSRWLLHGNFPVIKGIRHSIVYYIHSMLFHNHRDFTKLYSDFESETERDENGNIIFEPKPSQNFYDTHNLNSWTKITRELTKVPSNILDNRRKYIDLRAARYGLKAEEII